MTYLIGTLLLITINAIILIIATRIINTIIERERYR